MWLSACVALARIAKARRYSASTDEGAVARARELLAEDLTLIGFEVWDGRASGRRGAEASARHPGQYQTATPVDLGRSLRDVNRRNHTAAFPIYRDDCFDLASLALAFVAKADGAPNDRPPIEFDLAEILRICVRKPMKVDEGAVGHCSPICREHGREARARPVPATRKVPAMVQSYSAHGHPGKRNQGRRGFGSHPISIDPRRD